MGKGEKFPRGVSWWAVCRCGDDKLERCLERGCIRDGYDGEGERFPLGVTLWGVMK